MRLAPYLQKIAMRDRLDDFDGLTRYLIVSSSNGHVLFSPLSATMSSRSLCHYVGVFHSFCGLFCVCTTGRIMHIYLPQTRHLYRYLNSDDGFPHERPLSPQDFYQPVAASEETLLHNLPIIHVSEDLTHGVGEDPLI